MRIARIATTCALLAAVTVWSPARHASIPTRPAALASGWTTYHHDPARSGVDPNSPTFPASGSPLAQWNTSLDGDLYAEPLTLGNVIYQATEDNSIYALNETTGAAMWRWHLFDPQADPATAVGCGNINPVGITSTPVIDPNANLIYAVGLVAASGGGTKYQIFAVSLATGTEIAGFPRDLPEANPIYQLARAALNISPSGDYVYVAFGGWSGDCQPYHPIVVAVPVGPRLGQGQIEYQPQGATQGDAGIWGASGPAVDASGNVYVATGNGAFGSGVPCDNAQWDHSEAVIKLSPTVAELGSWAAANWCALNAVDNDIGSLGPILLQNGQLFQSGKPGNGYLLNTASLGGIGGELYSNHISNCPTSAAVFGGLAYSAPYVYVPCENTGLIALNVDTVAHNFTVAWKSALVFTPSAPIVAGGVVWTLGASTLYGYDPVSGAQRFSVAISGHTHFATPTEDNGWLLVPQTTSVRGLQFASSGPPPPAWLPLGGSLTSGPGAASCASGTAEVFVLGGDGVVWEKVFSSGSWSGWTRIGGNVMSNPAVACEPGTGNLHLFVEGTDHALYHKFWNGTSWGAWESFGGSLTSGPGVASCAAGTAQVFVLGGDGVVWEKTLSGGTWSGWIKVGGNVAGNPSAVCEPGTANIHLFVEGTDHVLYHKLWNGTSWGAWQNLGGSLSSSPAADSCAATKVDVFALGGDGVMWRNSFNGTTWTGWTQIGGSWTADPGATCQPATTKIDLVERGGDSGLWWLELPS